jgi:hypothetical protein
LVLDAQRTQAETQVLEKQFYFVNQSIAVVWGILKN